MGGRVVRSERRGPKRETERYALAVSGGLGNGGRNLAMVRI